MKNLSKSVAVATALLVSLSGSLSAQAGMTDNQKLAQCRATVLAEVGSVDKIKVANLKSRRGVFQAKFRVVANGERSMVLCKLDKQDVASVSCVSGDVCDSNKLVSNK